MKRIEKSVKKLVVLFAIFMLLASINTTLAQTTNPKWNMTNIEQNGGHFSICVDSKDNPHITYSSYKGLTYASWNGLVWSKQIIDSRVNNGSTMAVRGLSFVLDSSGNPHIAYTIFDYNEYNNQTLIYATRNGSTWTLQNVINAEEFGRISLALDHQNNPHISFSNGSLQIANWADSKWNIQTVFNDPTDSGNIDGASLALDANENPCISYSVSQGIYSEQKGYENFEFLKYSSWNGSVWSTQTVSQWEYQNAESSLVLDQLGHPHICYLNDKGAQYASWNGSKWSNQVIAEKSTKTPSLTLDSNGNPHISYSVVTETIETMIGNLYISDLMYAVWTGPSWNISKVASAGYYGESSLALDSKGNPCILYLYGNTNTIVGPFFVGGNDLMFASSAQRFNPTSSPNPEYFVVIVGTTVGVFAVLLLLRKRHQKSKIDLFV
jgi:hypothetical protein